MSYGLLTMEDNSAIPISLLLATAAGISENDAITVPANATSFNDTSLVSTTWPSTSPAPTLPAGAARPESVVGLSLLFCAIGFIGIVGNLLVIWVIMSDRKMRGSVTNLFILNLAAADLLIMLFGVPEIAQFMVNRGWLLGAAMCRVERYVLVVSLYVSIMSLVSVCIERWVYYLVHGGS